MADAILRAPIATSAAPSIPRDAPTGTASSAYSDSRPAAASAVGVSIRGLYKVFGPAPERVMPLVHQGVSKDELRNVHGHVLGLRDIHLEMKPGAIQVVMGLSGSGKSTLIRHINRLIDPTEGQVRVGDQDVTAMSARALREFRRQATAMVFQRFALFPHATVMENVQFGLEIKGVPRRQRREQAARWVERVGLAGYEDSYPNQLSGGMQQRVGLARALANDAPVLLMDEAFSALDPLIRHDMQSVLLDLQQEIGKTIVFITHDLDEALRLGDHIAILRDGQIEQVGTGQQIVLQPANDYIASFVRDVNRGRVIRCRTLVRPGPAVAGPRVEAGLVIEEAARLLSSEGLESANVVNAKGAHLGVVTMSDIVAAMVPPR
jgi:glycine betaine/proline transport system ATP-binding protein